MTELDHVAYSQRPGHVPEAEWRARVDLAACYRLAARNGWGDLIYTHLSLRLPGRDDAFLINPFGLSFDEITASNLLVIDLDGKVIDGSGRRANPSGFAIHGAVHRARADAHCVMHLHTDAGLSVAALEAGLLPLTQHAMRFWRDIAYHDYRGLEFGRDEQARLVAELANHRAMILKNHGTLTCGRTVAEAYVLMDTLEKACRTQLRAMAAGPVAAPPDDVVASTHAQLIADPEPEGALEWPALLRGLMRDDPGFAR
jgi:ribulose-5-phosphate 4-epimerase/fuculose-1-phosphate aldolase